MARQVQARKMRSKRRTSVKKRTPSSITTVAPIPKNIPTLGFYVHSDGSAYTTINYTSLQVAPVSAGLSAGPQVFRLNSLYDPDQTGTGLQGYNYDQLSALYSKYEVLGSKCTVEFSSDVNFGATTGISPLHVGVTPMNTVTLPSSNSEVLSTIPRTSSQFILPVGQEKAVCTVDFRPKRDLGINKGDDTNQAAIGSNPSSQFYAARWIYNPGTTAINVYTRTRVQYRVRFFQPTPNAGS